MPEPRRGTRRKREKNQQIFIRVQVPACAGRLSSTPWFDRSLDPELGAEGLTAGGAGEPFTPARQGVSP